MSPEHSNRAHSKWGASAAHRWFACPGSVSRSEGVVSPPSPYALEGTRAHELLESMLLGIKISAPEDCDQETLEAINVCFDYVDFLLDAYPGAKLLVEHRFELPSTVRPGEVFGTNDVIIYIPDTRELYVIDYKHGAGVAVEVIGNKQLRMYGVGAMFDHPDWIIDKVHLVIVQPRAFHPQGMIRSEDVEPADLIDFMGEIDAAIEKTLDPQAPLVPGTEQCRWCAISTGCPAREKQALTTIDANFGHIKDVSAKALPITQQMSPERIAYVMAARDLVLDWFDEVKEHALTLMKQGTFIPGFKLVESQAKRKWHGDPKEIVADLVLLSGGELEEQDFMETRLIPLTFAEAKLKDVLKAHAPRGQKKQAAETAKELMAFMTLKESSGNLTIARDTDGRPAVNPAQASFGHVTLPKIETAS